MKTSLKIGVVFILLLGLFYALLPNSRRSNQEKDFTFFPNKIRELKILLNDHYSRFYDFELYLDSTKLYVYEKEDSVTSHKYLSVPNAIHGEYKLVVIPLFETAKIFNLSVPKDSVFQLDSGTIKKYDSDTAHYNYFLSRIERNLPFNLFFDSYGCYSPLPSTRYSINSDSNSLQMIQHYERGEFVQSMDLDRKRFTKMLRLVMKENQNPTEEKPAYAIKGKDTTIIWVTSISTNSSSIYLQLKEKVYPIWSGDMHTDKSRETFYELYNGFVSPKVVLKL